MNLFYDQILFCVMIAIYFTINFDKAFKEFRKVFRIRPVENEAKAGNHHEKKNSDPVVVTEDENDRKKMLLMKIGKGKFDELIESLKFCLSFYASYNSIMLFIGMPTEIYLYGSKFYCNICAVLIAFAVAGLFLQPFFYDLDKSIKTPYEYLERRFESKLVRILGGFVHFLFLISFFTLFLCSIGITVGTLFPGMLDIWVAILIFGLVSILACCMGGIAQSVKLTTLQLLLFVAGIITALVATFYRNSRYTSNEVWGLINQYGRGNFVDLSVDLSTRYSLISQLAALPIPW